MANATGLGVHGKAGNRERRAVRDHPAGPLDDLDERVELGAVFSRANANQPLPVQTIRVRPVVLNGAIFSVNSKYSAAGRDRAEPAETEAHAEVAVGFGAQVV